MNVPFSLAIVDRGKAELAKDNGAVGGGSAADLDEVGANGEGDEILVGYALRAGPHAGLVLVPVVPPLEDLGLDGVLDDLEGLEGLLGGGMRVVELNHLVGGCIKNHGGRSVMLANVVYQMHAPMLSQDGQVSG